LLGEFEKGVNFGHPGAVDAEPDADDEIQATGRQGRVCVSVIF
jgi:hypothetical protein